MNNDWNLLAVTKIISAVYVAPNTGKHIHKKRPYHGFVLNDADSVKDYVFDDGYVLHTYGKSLFYLPKHSSYHVVQHKIGGCYAINFDSEISDTQFSVSFRNSDSLTHNFKETCNAWMNNQDSANALAMRTIYDAVYRMQAELRKQYVSGSGVALISPALKEIEQSFNDRNISVSSLAKACGVSEVYLRRLFIASFGVSPKEYIILKRIEYAKALLSSGHFSVSEIGAMCGYSEPCHFSREFSRRVGISPSKYSGE